MLETRVKEPSCKNIVDKQFRYWNFVNNYSYVVNGRVWVLWRGLAAVNDVDIMGQCITLSFEVERKEIWLSIMYVANEAMDRRSLWAYLRDLKLRIR